MLERFVKNIFDESFSLQFYEKYIFTNEMSDNIINLHNIMKNTKVLCKIDRYKVQMD